jgi:hypothetical protein
MSAFVHGRKTSFSSGAASSSLFRVNSTQVAARIAKSMLGRAVSIRLGNGDTIHGIVTEVLADGRKPKVIVGGSEYLVAQVLIAAPPETVTEDSFYDSREGILGDYLL